MGPMKEDKDPSEFSLIFKFINQGEDIVKWQLGFYMAGTPLAKFVKGEQNFNPKLIRQICDEDDHCVSLNYDTNKNIKDPDLSQGYTSIHSPSTYFPLKKGKKYEFKLLHINQWGGGNVSYFPQNFFLISSNKYKKKIIYTMGSDIKSYSVGSYDHDQVKEKIKKYVQKNWDTSAKNTIENDKVVPKPVFISIKPGDNFLLDKNVAIFCFSKPIGNHVLTTLGEKS